MRYLLRKSNALSSCCPPQTAFSDCVLWTDTQRRNSSGRRQNLEATAPLTQFSSTNYMYGPSSPLFVCSLTFFMVIKIDTFLSDIKQQFVVPFCVSACCWPGEEAEWVWKSQAARNSHPVWKCHPGAFRNQWDKVLWLRELQHHVWHCVPDTIDFNSVLIRDEF